LGSIASSHRAPTAKEIELRKKKKEAEEVLPLPPFLSLPPSLSRPRSPSRALLLSITLAPTCTPSSSLFFSSPPSRVSRAHPSLLFSLCHVYVDIGNTENIATYCYFFGCARSDFFLFRILLFLNRNEQGSSKLSKCLRRPDLTHANTHTQTNAHKHTQNTHKHSNIRTHMHTHKHTNTLTLSLSHTHSLSRTHTHTPLLRSPSLSPLPLRALSHALSHALLVSLAHALSCSPVRVRVLSCMHSLSHALSRALSRYFLVCVCVCTHVS